MDFMNLYEFPFLKRKPFLYNHFMYKKIIIISIISSFLVSCGISQSNESSLKNPSPVSKVSKTEDSPLVETNSGFTTDLNKIIEDSYNTASTWATKK